MKKLISSIIALASFGLMAASVSAQPALKIFFIDMAKVYDGHYETEEQNAKLQGEEKKAQDEIQRLNKEGNDLVEQLKQMQEDAKNPALSVEAKNKLQADFQAKAEEIQKKKNEVQGFAQNARNSFQQRIKAFREVMLEKLSKTATEVAKRKGGTILIDKSGPTLLGISPVIYFDPAYDITEEVSKEVNKGRGSSSSSASPAKSSSSATNTSSGSSSGSSSGISFPGAK
ncbi:OmpH family outer membrane protein [Opitutaceae bacterium TAV4]|nr:OmpH family outer membrane protein [Opitutaceae bacterium TAV4]RRK01948.1 OmpH family outer membrane protein [Opitutaceae bacterium TAV3]